MTKRTLRLGALALMLAATGTAGWSANTPADGVPAGEFSAHFTPYAAVPATLSVSERAVDLTTFDAPVDEAAEEPGASEAEVFATGTASFYGRKFHGRPTASGARFDMHAMTAAHRTLPFGTKLRVTNARNGRSVVVTVNDRGPFHGSRILDVSRAAAERLSMVGSGSARVRLELVG